MAGRTGEDHLVVEERLEGDRAVAAGGADDPELELARGDAFDDGLRVGHRQRDPDARVLTLQLAEEPCTTYGGRARGGAPPPQLAGPLALALARDLVATPTLEREQPLGAAIEPYPASVGSTRRPERSSRAPELLLSAAPGERRRAG